jgi:hypothetical protein
LTSFIMQPLLSLTLGFSLLSRIFLALLLVGQLGLLLGVPFSTGLRLVAEEAPALVPWAWAVNGFFTVIGSIGAMILGMILGFSTVLLIAACCYGLALAAMRMSKPSEYATSLEARSNTSGPTIAPGNTAGRARGAAA